MKRTLKKLIGLMLVFALLTVPAANTVTAVNSVTEETENPYNKLHFYLDNEENYTIDSYSELAQATASLKTNAATYALTNTEDTAESELHVTVEFASNFMETAKYQEFLNERETLETIDEVHEWRARLNAYSKEFHENLVAKNMKSLSDMEYSDYDVIGYSPFVVLRTSPDDISTAALLDVASCAGVEHVSVAYEEIPENSDIDIGYPTVEWDDCLRAVGAYDVVDKGIYTGDGVRVGIYEVGELLDMTHTNLIGKNIIKRNYTPDYGDMTPEDISNACEHARNVTSVAALIAPEAEFYVSARYGDSLEWFIDQGCDIVNCSFGYNDNLGYKYNVDAIYDYQVKAHRITMVACAGNTSSQNEFGEVSSPGCAVNTITVGGVNCFYGAWSHSASACYIYPDNDFAIVKPNVSAPYKMGIPYIGSKAGTSYSTPMVTGCIALFLEANPSYLTTPEKILSLITATAQETSDYSNDIGEFDDGVGAGMINLDMMLCANLNCIGAYNTNFSSGVEIQSHSIYLTAGDNIQVALAWLIDIKSSAYESGVITDNYIYVTDYDLYLYDSNNNPVAYSRLRKGNVELIRWATTLSGVYRIVAYQAGYKHLNNSGDPISFTYCIT